MHYGAVVTAISLQRHRPNGWQTIATLEFPEPSRGARGGCWLEYETDYAIACLSDEAPAGEAVLRRTGLGYPVDFAPRYCEPWPGFLDDIRPGGAARRWWVDRLGLGRAESSECEFPLLARGSIAPIGHLRVTEAVPPRPSEAPPRFDLGDVADRDHFFLAYATEMGASVGGATGAGGSAPKLLLRMAADEQVWIDTWQDEWTSPDRHYLVKFARNQRTERDKAVLRSEYVYYLALAELGVDTIDTTGMRLIEGAREPGLWLPRFDVARDADGREVRHGLESLYSLIEAPGGSWQAHEDYLTAIHAALVGQPGYDREQVTADYLGRDLLNLVFGNSDNHGRNAAILKTTARARLAPVYDFAPMKLDPEGVVRVTRWRDHERRGQIDWAGLLSAWDETGRVIASVRGLAAQLTDLPDRLEALGLPEETLAYGPIGLLGTRDKLARWGLL